MLSIVHSSLIIHSAWGTAPSANPNGLGLPGTVGP